MRVPASSRVFKSPAPVDLSHSTPPLSRALCFFTHSFSCSLSLPLSLSLCTHFRCNRLHDDLKIFCNLYLSLSTSLALSFFTHLGYNTFLESLTIAFIRLSLSLSLSFSLSLSLSLARSLARSLSLSQSPARSVSLSHYLATHPPSLQQPPREF